MKEALKEAVVEAMVEILWSDPVEDRLCDLSRATVGGYLENDEPYTWRDPKTGELIKGNRYVPASEYLQSIEELLERLVYALGA